MNEHIKEIIEQNYEIDNQEIAKQINEGKTSGILDNEAGYRILWSLKAERFEY